MFLQAIFFTSGGSNSARNAFALRIGIAEITGNAIRIIGKSGGAKAGGLCKGLRAAMAKPGAAGEGYFAIGGLGGEHQSVGSAAIGNRKGAFHFVAVYIIIIKAYGHY